LALSGLISETKDDKIVLPKIK